MIHSVAVAWDDLLQAFSSMEHDKAFFFDKFTGEIFAVSSNEEDEVWDEIEQHRGRFLEIPGLDQTDELGLLQSFKDSQDDPELCRLLDHAISCCPPYVKTSDIMAFFPEEEQQLADLRESFLNDRVKSWMEANELFSVTTAPTVFN